MPQATIWWRVPRSSTREENAAALTAAIRTVHPAAPEVTEFLAYPLLGKRPQILVLGDDGSEMVLTKVDITNDGDVRRLEIRIEFTMSDYGLGEFDEIMHSMAQSAPVAAAIKAIAFEEAQLPLLATATMP